MKINIHPGDSLEISQVLQNDVSSRGRMKKSVYEVLQVLPYFVLCRKIPGGYRECFTWHQLYEGRVIDWEKFMGKCVLALLRRRNKF